MVDAVSMRDRIGTSVTGGDMVKADAVGRVGRVIGSLLWADAAQTVRAQLRYLNRNDCAW